MEALTIAVGTDTHHEVAERITAELESRNCVVRRFGFDAVLPWPDVALAVARSVVTGEAASGIVCCWTGTGVAIAANKIQGVRAALCTDARMVRDAKRWNDANVLALSLERTPVDDIGPIVGAWLEAIPIDPAEAASIAKVSELEQRNDLAKT